jgi:hypothetical protein
MLAVNNLSIRGSASRSGTSRSTARAYSSKSCEEGAVEKTQVVVSTTAATAIATDNLPQLQ